MVDITPYYSDGNIIQASNLQEVKTAVDNALTKTGKTFTWQYYPTTPQGSIITFNTINELKTATDTAYDGLILMRCADDAHDNGYDSVDSQDSGYDGKWTYKSGDDSVNTKYTADYDYFTGYANHSYYSKNSVDSQDSVDSHDSGYKGVNSSYCSDNSVKST